MLRKDGKSYKGTHSLLVVTMEIRYDEEADAIYIKLRDGDFAKNKIIDDLTILDLDKEDNLLGIELLDASKRIPPKSLSKIYVKNLSVAR